MEPQPDNWESCLTGFLRQRRFIAFDTETTGMWAVSNRIVELAAVKFRLGDEQAETFQELVNPRRPIPGEVIEIHGITNEMVVDADPIGPVLNRFMDFCGPDDILIAHNAPFDISFITCELEREKLDFGKNLVIDTVDICKRYFPGLSSYSLLSLAREFGIARTQNHRALEDALLVWKLFCHAARTLPEIHNLDDFRAAVTTYTIEKQPDVDINLPERFADLATAINRQKRLEIDYRPANKPSQSRTIRPIRIHALNSTLYLNAFCEQVQTELTFRLDRIDSIRLLEE